MATELKVYLDHLIERENLRYKQPDTRLRATKGTPDSLLRLIDIERQEETARSLRKPDFQRATTAWSPDDCLSLLDSLINYQVIPSIIMWRSSENGFRYILDGGHRVSVVIAWLMDDWGDNYSGSQLTPAQQQMNLKAGHAIRELVAERIGTIDEYKLAAEQMYQLTKDRKSPADEMDPVAFERGLFYQSLRGGDIAFNILWVDGDYNTAERSFLKINKSGRQLSEWETKLIEHRDSSIARTIMSIASVSSSSYYWPESSYDDETLQQKIGEILDSIRYLEHILLYPEYKRPITSLTQPLLVASQEKKPYYIAEFLTVIKGYRGQVSETQQLLESDRDATERQIVENGYELVTQARGLIDHIVGNPDRHDPANKSLELVPLLYFYKSDGTYIRSLFYGFLYFLIKGTDDEIRRRKEILCAYRESFEHVLLRDKDTVVSMIGRNVGSGSEVTLHTSNYYQELLQALTDHNGDIESDDFLTHYVGILNTLIGGRPKSHKKETVKSRLFTQKQKNTALVEAFLKDSTRCGICGGRLDPARKLQHDHKKPVSEGGTTSASNQAITHPFCNNRKKGILAIQDGSSRPNLPRFEYVLDPEAPRQLNFINDLFFSDNEEV